MKHSLFLFAILIACGGDDGGNDVPPDVMLRACNASTYDFATLHFQTPEDNSGPLPAGQCTPYRDAPDFVYHYTLVQFTVGTDEFSIIPTDYVGETPLAEGSWSYEIRIADYEGHNATVWAVAD